MTEFVVHGIPGSPYVRAVLLALEEKRLPWRLAAIPFGGNRAPEFAAYQPFNKIPAVEHGDFRLYETQAILRYLDRIAPEPAMIPADARAEARMNQIIGITDCYVAPRVSGAVSFPRAVAPFFGLPVDEDAVTAAIPIAAHTVGVVAGLLGANAFMAGDAISLADCMIAPHLSFLATHADGQAMLAPHPNLLAWIARIDSRPSMAATSWERLQALTAAAA